jgi:protein gp37
MADVFEDRPELEDQRGRLVVLTEQTPNLIWLLLTKRPENVRTMVPPRWLHEQWPANVWVGTTVEDQRRARERLPYLAEIPAPVRFLSMEPLLEPVELPDDGFDWVIVGGESGPGHRPFDALWASWLRDDCLAAEVPFFFKQHGGHTAKAGGHLLDGEVIQQFPAAAMR